MDRFMKKDIIKIFLCMMVLTVFCALVVALVISFTPKQAESFEMPALLSNNTIAVSIRNGTYDYSKHWKVVPSVGDMKDYERIVYGAVCHAGVVGDNTYISYEWKFYGEFLTVNKSSANLSAQTFYSKRYLQITPQNVIINVCFKP